MGWANPEKRKRYNKDYYIKNREKITQQQAEYRLRTNDKERCKKYYHNNKETKVKEYREKNKEKRIAQAIIWRKNNEEKRKLWWKNYYAKPETKERLRLYNKNNPRSQCSSYPLELELAMNNVRKRDMNTCQWYNCKLTYKEAPIHVHHIFPRSEYPKLELIEKYMICYCANHHGLWHRYRGDSYSKFITALINRGKN